MTDQDAVAVAVQLGVLEERMRQVRDGQDTIIERVAALPCPKHLERVTRIEERQEAQQRSLARIEEAQRRAAERIEEALQRPPAPDRPAGRAARWTPAAVAAFVVGIVEGVKALVK